MSFLMISLACFLGLIGISAGQVSVLGPYPYSQAQCQTNCANSIQIGVYGCIGWSFNSAANTCFFYTTSTGNAYGEFYGYASAPNVTFTGLLSGIQTSLSPFANASQGTCQAWCTAPNQYNGCVAWSYVSNTCFYYSTMGTNFFTGVYGTPTTAAVTSGVVTGIMPAGSVVQTSQSQCQSICQKANNAIFNSCALWNFLSNGLCNIYNAFSSAYTTVGQYGYASNGNISYTGQLNGNLLVAPIANATVSQCQYYCTSANNASYTGCQAWYYANNECFYYSSYTTPITIG